MGASRALHPPARRRHSVTDTEGPEPELQSPGPSRWSARRRDSGGQGRQREARARADSAARPGVQLSHHTEPSSPTEGGLTRESDYLQAVWFLILSDRVDSGAFAKVHDQCWGRNIRIQTPPHPTPGPAGGARRLPYPSTPAGVMCRCRGNGYEPREPSGRTIDSDDRVPDRLAPTHALPTSPSRGGDGGSRVSGALGHWYQRDQHHVDPGSGPSDPYPLPRPGPGARQVPDPCDVIALQYMRALLAGRRGALVRPMRQTHAAAHHVRARSLPPSANRPPRQASGPRGRVLSQIVAIATASITAARRRPSRTASSAATRRGAHHRSQSSRYWPCSPVQASSGQPSTHFSQPGGTAMTATLTFAPPTLRLGTDGRPMERSGCHMGLLRLCRSVARPTAETGIPMHPGLPCRCMVKLVSVCEEESSRLKTRVTMVGPLERSGPDDRVRRDHRNHIHALVVVRHIVHQRTILMVSCSNSKQQLPRNNLIC